MITLRKILHVNATEHTELGPDVTKKNYKISSGVLTFKEKCFILWVPGFSA
jgi:hypothetical protein